jgi:hypothetical protein
MLSLTFCLFVLPLGVVVCADLWRCKGSSDFFSLVGCMREKTYAKLPLDPCVAVEGVKMLELISGGGTSGAFVLGKLLEFGQKQFQERQNDEKGWVGPVVANLAADAVARGSASVARDRRGRRGGRGVTGAGTSGSGSDSDSESDSDCDEGGIAVEGDGDLAPAATLSVFPSFCFPEPPLPIIDSGAGDGVASSPLFAGRVPLPCYRGGVEVAVADVKTLDTGGCLSATVVDAVLKLLLCRCTVDCVRSGVHLFSPHFFPDYIGLEEEWSARRGFQRVAHHVGNDCEVLSKSLLVFPICLE